MTLVDGYRTAAERFLQSALVVDDIPIQIQALETTRTPLESPDPLSELHGDPVAAAAAAQVAANEPVDVGGGPTPPAQDEVPVNTTVAAGAVPLDTLRLAEVFGERGIVCAALRPDPGDDLHDIVVRVGRRCDIVVLDWHIDSTDLDRTALPLLDSLTDPIFPGLRLVAIYTGDPRLGDIVEAILGLSDVEENAEPFRFRRGHSHILILSKDDARITSHVPGAETVAVEDLPDRLISEFARHARGLIPSSTMSALGAVRERVLEVLTVLSRHLDAGFVGHRLALPVPDDATDHLADLIVSELASIIADDASRAICTDRSTVQLWLDELDPGAISAPSSPDVLRILNESGSGKAGASALATRVFDSKKKVKEFLEGDTSTFFMSKAAAALADARLAERMATVHAYVNSRPAHLELGAIVRDVVEDRYLVCVLPVCDSVRLDKRCAVPFLPLEVVESKPFDITLVRDEAPLRLRLQPRPVLLRMVEFEPDMTAGFIMPTPHGALDAKFLAVGGREFEPVVRLKPSQSLRIAHQLASSFSRIGLNESEWQRRQALR